LLFSTAHPALQAALARKSYTEPTAVQAAVLGAEDRDLLVSAQTGSGKTVAFGIFLARSLLGDAPKVAQAGAPKALIVTPTRELAMQVQRELAWLYADSGARITTCVGGMDPRRERYALDHGVHVVVGTPGRLCDHLERGSLKLDQLQTVVLDEADEMLDMGFREDIEKLLDASPTERRTLLFSATIPPGIAQLAKRYQKNAHRIAATNERERHIDIEYQAVPVVPRERDLAIVNLLRYHEATGALVFCATRDGVARLAAQLDERGFPVVALSGELSQRERNVALQALRDGRARVCVATDVAARGLDLPDLGLVIHADLPQNQQILVHRSGRTGRAGKRGTAIILVHDNARRYVDRMLQSANIAAKWLPAPSADEILVRDGTHLATEIAGMTADITDEDREVAKTLLANQSAEELVAALVRIRRAARPAPEELTVPPSMRPQQQSRPSQRPERFERTNRPARDFGARHDHGSHQPRAPRHDAPRHDAPRHEASERAEDGTTRGVWFTINVGRSKNADPKWLVPLICRRGGISKRDIGKIQILQRNTRVEIAPDVSARFAIEAGKPDPKDRNIHIEVDGESLPS
jgi:ATP-dependent RNA helicase DeaD